MKLTNEPFVRSNESIVRRLRNGQRGQSIVIMAIFLVVLLGATGFVIDVGHLYFAYQELQTATQAAALAGGYSLSNNTASVAIAAATNYSGVSGDLNAHSNLTGVTMVAGYPKVKCLTSSLLPQCSASPANANAVVVVEQATVPTTFARVLGFTSWTISATATAAARGGSGGPYNVVLILDATSSMNNTDSDSQCGSTRIHCALAGIRTLLGSLSPCPATLTSCGPATSGNVANPIDEVALMAFPGLTSAAEAAKDYACPTGSPKSTTYNSSPVYQIIALSSDYRTSDTATSLNSSSNLVIAAGGGCSSGVAAPGGQGTFYAGVIDTAQAYLTASSRPNTKNVMILLSDGNAGNGKMGPATPYPATNQCHQAITRAQAAATAGTIVYAVAYGAQSSGCSGEAITPCQTMQQIASSPENFFSDYTATGSSGSCVSASRPTSSLNQIFTEIAVDLTVARLIPNNTP